MPKVCYHLSVMPCITNVCFLFTLFVYRQTTDAYNETCQNSEVPQLPVHSFGPDSRKTRLSVAADMFVEETAVSRYVAQSLL
jgi:hypothetical protein